LGGTGVEAYRSASVDTYFVDFGWVKPSDAPTTRSFFLTSNGSVPFTITSYYWDRDPSGAYSVVSGLEPTPVAPGETREVVIAFDPATEGDFNASIYVNGDFSYFSGFEIHTDGSAFEGDPPSGYTANGPGLSRIGVGRDYATIGEAMAALSNTSLVGGDWVFEVTENITEFSQATLSNFQSNGNSVIFRPAASTQPVAAFIVGGVPAIVINNSDDIVFEGSNTVGGDTRDMTLMSVYTNSLSVFEIRQGTQNLTLRNMIVRTDSNSSALSSSPVFVTYTEVDGNPSVVPRGIRIENCLLSASTSPTGAGVTVRTTPFSGQSALTDGPDVVIVDSDIEVGQRAFFTTHVKSLVFERNRVKISQPGAGFNTFGMLFTSLGANPPSNDTNVSIRNNVFRQVSAKTNAASVDLGAILLDQIGTNQVFNIENNAISLHLDRATGGNINKLYGIAQTRATSSTLNILHNSINIVPSTTAIAGMTPERSYVVGVTSAANTGTVNVRNNVFVNGQPGGAAINIAPTSGTLTMDGNVYFNDTASQAVVAAGVPVTLATWQSTGQDLNSTFADARVAQSPFRGHWLSSGSGDTDLRFTSNPGLGFQKTPLAAITTDIDGETRGSSFVFSGFDEVADSDSDGLASSIEDSVPGGDGNGDSIADRDQPGVISYLTGPSLYPITLAASTGVFVESSPTTNPSPGDVPSGASFPTGFYGFNLAGVPTGGAVTVLLYLPNTVSVNTIYKYGAEPGDPTPHWYKFDYDGTTGAVIVDNLVTLHFVDGQRGDDDLTANGVIVDPAGPAFETTDVPDWAILD
ncbi:DUF1573 domain-containing protein, partial [bacterium]|nr:DUF1573 domain-containing protein [bacterium]